MGYTFSKHDADRIAAMVRRSEATPYGHAEHSRQHHFKNSTPYVYEGPFAVVDASEDDDIKVTILGYNLEEDRHWRNYIDAGLATPLELDEQDLAIGGSGWVYLTLTQTGGVYDTPTVAIAETLPAQDNTHYYHRLAYVRYEDEAIAYIEQWQYGGLALPGRAF